VESLRIAPIRAEGDRWLAGTCGLRDVMIARVVFQAGRPAGARRLQHGGRGAGGRPAGEDALPGGEPDGD